MRKFLFLFLALMLCFSFSALAADAPTTVEVPSWIGAVLAFLENLPYVGEVLAKAVLIAGVASAILTALSAAAASIIATLKATFSLTGLDKAEAAMAWLQAKVMPWLKYLSMYNVQKKKV